MLDSDRTSIIIYAPHKKSTLNLLIFLGNLLNQLVDGVEQQNIIQTANEQNHLSGPSNLIRRALESRTKTSNQLKIQYKLGGNECSSIALICSMYQTALDTLTQLRLDILTGICYQEHILYDLWLFLTTLGPCCGLKSFIDLLMINVKCSSPEFQMLQLFCDCTTHCVT